MNNNLSLLSISKDITNTLSRICIMTIFFMYFSEIIGQTPVTGFISILYVAVTCFVDYYARKCCKNILMFLLFYIAMFPVMLLLPVITSEKIVLAVYLVLTYFLALKFWVSEETSKLKCVVVFPSEMIVILIPIYFHSLYRLSDRLTTYIFVLSIIFISLNFVDQFMEKLLTYMLSIPTGSIVPLTRVFATNMSSIIFVILIGCVTIFAISDFTFGDGIILNIILTFATLLGKMLVGIGNFSSKFKLKESGDFEEETTTSPGNQLEAEVGNSLEANELIAYISRILSMVLLVAFAIFVIYLIIKFISMHFRKNSTGNEIIEKAEKVVSEKTTKNRKFFSLFKAKDNNEKARRLYKKKILTYKDTFIKIDNSDAPKDIENKIKNKSGDNLKDLTVMYEAARYGEDIISDSELSIIKKMTKK